MRTSKQYRDLAEEFRAIASMRGEIARRITLSIAVTYDRMAVQAEIDEAEWAKFLRQQENINGVQTRGCCKEKDPH